MAARTLVKPLLPRRLQPMVRMPIQRAWLLLRHRLKKLKMHLCLRAEPALAPTAGGSALRMEMLHFLPRDRHPSGLCHRAF